MSVGQDHCSSFFTQGEDVNLYNSGTKSKLLAKALKAWLVFDVLERAKFRQLPFSQYTYASWGLHLRFLLKVRLIFYQIFPADLWFDICILKCQFFHENLGQLTPSSAPAQGLEPSRLQSHSLSNECLVNE